MLLPSLGPFVAHATYEWMRDLETGDIKKFLPFFKLFASP
jgi:hypothetical protein